MKILLNTFRALFLVAFILCTLGVFYPVVGMSAEEETRGKIVLGVLATIFLVLTWLISRFLKSRKNSGVTQTQSIFNPYSVEYSNDSVVYEYKTLYVYLLYLILATMAAGYFANITELSVLGILLLVGYFLLISTQYIRLGKITKRASISSSVEVSGSKWSFSSPLRIKIDKNDT